MSGSELVQKFIGEGSRMVRELFVMAREHAPSIIFMDEIDSIGSARIESSGGGDSEVQRTMLELLNQLDGFEATKNIKLADLFKAVHLDRGIKVYYFQVVRFLFRDGGPPRNNRFEQQTGWKNHPVVNKRFKTHTHTWQTQLGKQND